MSFAVNARGKKRAAEAPATDAPTVAKQQKLERERLRSLIITLGDENKKIVGQIRGLAGALEDDVELHGELIAQTAVDCAKHMAVKTNIYAAWVGRMADKHPAWVASLIPQALSELQAALRAGQASTAQLLLQFLVGLGNYGVLGLAPLLKLLQDVAALSAGLRPAKGGDLGLFLALASLTHLSAAAKAQVTEQVQDIVAKAAAYVGARDASWKPLLRILRTEELPDRLEALLAAVRSLEKSSWTSLAVLHVPGFKPSLEGRDDVSASLVLGVTAEDLKRQKLRFHVPLVASRLLTRELERDGADDHLSEHDRWILEDHLLLIMAMFERDVEECARQILKVPVLHADFESVVIEVVFSQMLRLPVPPALPLFYSRLLEALVAKQSTLQPFVDRAYRALAESAEDLDDECLEVIAEVFAYHLVNRGYQFDWSIFTGGEVNMQAQRFIRHALDRLLRLSFHQNLLHRLPEAMHAYVPPEPLPLAKLPAQDKSEYTKLLGLIRLKDPDPEKVLEFCQELQRPHREGGSDVKVEEPEAPAAGAEGAVVDAWPLSEVAELLASAAMQLGSKTTTHMSKLLDGHTSVFEKLRPEDASAANAFEKALLQVVFDFWGASSQRLELTVDGLLQRRLVAPRAVVEGALAQRGAQGCDSMAVRNLLDGVARRSLELSQTARVELALAKQVGKPELLESCRQRLDASIQETAELFTVIFTGLVRNFEDLADSDALVRHVMLQRLLTIGRKYHLFIKPLIEAADVRVPGVSRNPEVAAIFQSLRAL